MHFGHARRLDVTLVQPGEAQAPPVVDAMLSCSIASKLYSSSKRVCEGDGRPEAEEIWPTDQNRRLQQRRKSESELQKTPKTVLFVLHTWSFSRLRCGLNSQIIQNAGKLHGTTCQCKLLT